MEQKRFKDFKAKPCRDNRRKLKALSIYVVNIREGRTNSCKAAVSQVRCKCIEKKEPHLRVEHSLYGLVPFKGAEVEHTRFILERPLHGNCALLLLKEDGFGWRVWEEQKKDEGISRRNGTEDKKYQLPVRDACRVDMPNGVGDQAT